MPKANFKVDPDNEMSKNFSKVHRRPPKDMDELVAWLLTWPQITKLRGDKSWEDFREQIIGVVSTYRVKEGESTVKDSEELDPHSARMALLDGVSDTLARFEAKHGTGKTNEPPRPKPDLKLLSFDDDGAEQPDIIDVEPIEPAPEAQPDPVEIKTLMSLNDRFRKAYPGEDPTIPGFKITSEAITAKGPVFQSSVERMVAEFDDFDLTDTMHDFGVINHPDGEIVFHVDCFVNEDCKDYSEHPEDPTRSYRVLTIILASEVA